MKEEKFNLLGGIGNLKEDLEEMFLIHDLIVADNQLNLYCEQSKTFNGTPFQFIYYVLFNEGFDPYNKKKETHYIVDEKTGEKKRNYERESIVRLAKRKNLTFDQAKLYKIEKKERSKNKKSFSLDIFDSILNKQLSFSSNILFIKHLTETREVTFGAAKSDLFRTKKKKEKKSNFGYSILN